MNRREALAATASLFGASIIGSNLFLSGCGSPDRKPGLLFSSTEIRLLDEIGETILPASAKSTGARAAQIGNFIQVIVTDCYDEKQQKVMKEGLSVFGDYCIKHAGADFLTLDATQKLEVLTKLDAETTDYAAKRTPADADHYFTMLKQLTIWGYFTSEQGATKSLRFVPIPGRYEGCVPYLKGQGAWLY